MEVDMTVEEVMEKIEQYEQPQQDAIRLAMATAEGDVLEAMLEQIVG